jgi:hypothetical protein
VVKKFAVFFHPLFVVQKAVPNQQIQKRQKMFPSHEVFPEAAVFSTSQKNVYPLGFTISGIKGRLFCGIRMLKQRG